MNHVCGFEKGSKFYPLSIRNGNTFFCSMTFHRKTFAGIKFTHRYITLRPASRGGRGYMKHGVKWNTNFKNVISINEKLKKDEINPMFHFAPSFFVYHLAPSCPTLIRRVIYQKICQVEICRKTLAHFSRRHLHAGALARKKYDRNTFSRKKFTCSDIWPLPLWAYVFRANVLWTFVRHEGRLYSTVLSLLALSYGCSRHEAFEAFDAKFQWPNPMSCWNKSLTKRTAWLS
jgi:hypothetical protein